MRVIMGFPIQFGPQHNGSRGIDNPQMGFRLGFVVLAIQGLQKRLPETLFIGIHHTGLLQLPVFQLDRVDYCGYFLGVDGSLPPVDNALQLHVGEDNDYHCDKA